MSVYEGTKLADMHGVREHTERDPVELWLYKGRVVVRCYNEGHNNYTDLDVADFLAWWNSPDRTAFVKDQP